MWSYDGRSNVKKGFECIKAPKYSVIKLQVMLGEGTYFF